MTDILGAFRSGLYATFSIVIPRMTVTMTVSGSERYSGITVLAYIVTSPATIKISPWAKLIRRKMPYTIV